MPRAKEYSLPERKYSTDFLRALAIVAHRNLIEPEEIKHWFYEDQLSNKEIYLRMQHHIDNMEN